MPIKRFESSMTVLEAARQRIRNLFACGCKVYLSFSCGKDSLCMSSLTYDLIVSGEIDKSLLTVIFVDEEGLYKSMVDAALRWRQRFMAIGVPFIWLCLPMKQVSVIDHLSAAESWITWEPGKEHLWIRDPPPFAVMRHPLMKHPGQMNYQSFCKLAFADGIQMIGLRTAESLTRLQCIARRDMSRTGPGDSFYPIYDWKDNDVWLYIRERRLEFPEIYMRLYEAGVQKRNLRLCAFFGDCGTQGLRWIAETDNELWTRIEKREPNAYLVLLYWDSEMFRRSSSKRRALEAGAAQKDYDALCKDVLFLNTEKYTIAPDTKKNLNNWRSLYIKSHGIANQSHYKKMYEGILYGDPKNRVLRILWSDVFGDYSSRAFAPISEVR